MVTITSTVHAYQRLAAITAGPRRLRAWIDQYEPTHAEVFAAYHASHGSPSTRAEAANRVDDMAPEIVSREQRLRVLLARVESDFHYHKLLASDTDVPVVLLVGTGHSDAWVDVFRNAPTLFIALEQLHEPADDGLLVTHEMVHIAHYQAQAPLLRSHPHLRDHVAFRIWAEGLAVAGTRLLDPGRADSDYLFAPDDHWGDDCRASLPAVARNLQDRIDHIDGDLLHSLCDVTDDEPWPSRIGYWIGDQIVQEHLAAGHLLATLLGWSPDQVTAAIRGSKLLRAVS